MRPHKEPETLKSGLGGYADMVYELSRSAGYVTDETELEFGLKNGFIKLVMDDFIGSFAKILTMKRNDVCHFVFEGSAAYILFCRSKKVVTFHHYVYKNENNSKKWYIVWKMSAMMAVKCADRIIAISDQTRDEIVNELGADPSKIRVISHLANESLHVDDNIPKKKWIGSMGTLTERKNYLTLVEIFSELLKNPMMKNYELHICGKGPMKNKIIDRAKDLGVDSKLFFHQNLDNEELNIFYNRCKLTLNTSLHEGLGMLTLESQMCGTPVLFFKNANIPRNTTKTAIACDDPEDMVSKTIEIIQNEDLYSNTVNQGLLYIDEYRRVYRESTLDVYRELS